MDITLYTMILCCKLWGLSFAYKDGFVSKQNLTADQYERRVVFLPNLMEYVSFVSFSCGNLCGPFMEYSDFKDWIEFSGNYKYLPRGLEGGFVCLPQVLRRFAEAMGCLSLNILICGILGFYPRACTTDEFANGDFKYNFIFYNMAMTGQRFMYYTPWCL